MPSSITHCLYGRKTIELVSDIKLKDLIARHQALFYIGTQGPDIFFYYRTIPFSKSKKIHKTGKRMHHESVSQFFSQIVNYINNTSGIEKEMLIAYFCGFITHYILDTHTHPYIFYRSGFNNPSEPPTSKYPYFHRRFETALDVLMLKRISGIRPADFEIHSVLSVTRDQGFSVGNMLEKMLKDIYGENIKAKKIYSSMRDMSNIHRIIRDRTGFKKRLLSGMENLFGLYPVLSCMIFPLEIKDGLDYLNLQHNKWYLPWNKEIFRTDSFVDMFDSASKVAKETLEAYWNTIQSNRSIDDLINLLGNNDYSSGVDCTLQLEFLYFDNIFEKNSEEI